MRGFAFAALPQVFVWNQGSVLRRNCEITVADSREIGIKIRVSHITGAFEAWI
jgi:hypothetical protein